VPPTPLSLDTSPEIERMQIEYWRQMSPGEQLLRLALITLGPDLARQTYSEITATDLP